MQDLEDLDIGEVMDMYVEKANDSYDYAILATQDDIDNF